MPVALNLQGDVNSYYKNIYQMFKINAIKVHYIASPPQRDTDGNLDKSGYICLVQDDTGLNITSLIENHLFQDNARLVSTRSNATLTCKVPEAWKQWRPIADNSTTILTNYCLLLNHTIQDVEVVGHLVTELDVSFR
jgi:hypothetical protein